VALVEIEIVGAFSWVCGDFQTENIG